MWQFAVVLAACAVRLASGEAGFTAALPGVTDKPPVRRTLNKRPSLEPSGIPDMRSVIESFQINENRIIRTEDSRRMGARYLNETQMASNRDCLFWCWQTSSCNVAVFEEKGKGSCYLFDCGPPSRFVCLFTAHRFYTVSVLAAVGGRDLDPGSWGSHHEDELTQLRQQLRAPTVAPQTLEVTQAPPATSPAAFAVPASTLPDAQPEPRCRHYQFQCQNSSECIAVYNVCDGIPQCPDGSDEAADLKCPRMAEASNAPSAPTTVAPRTPPEQRGTTPTVPMRHGAPPQQDLVDDQVPGGPPADIGPQGRAPMAPPSRLRWSEEGARLGRPEYSHYEDPFPVAGDQAKYYDYGGYPEGSRYWVGDPDAQAYPLLTEGMLQPQSFRPHKTGPRMSLQQQQEMQRQHRQRQLKQLQQELQLQKQQAPPNHMQGYPTNQWKMMHRPPPMAVDQQEGQAGQAPFGSPPLLYGRHPQTGQMGSQPQAPDAEGPVGGRPGRLPEEPKQAQGHIVMPAKPQTPEDDNLYQPIVEVAPPPVVPAQHQDATKQTSKQQPSKPTEAKAGKAAPGTAEGAHRRGPVQYSRLHEVANMQVSFTQVEQGGGAHAQQESGSAVLALTLGLCITGLLLVLVGCRLRLARHRLARRGGRSSLAHDADYLVNGMYL
ncbi:hypothetical protein HPB47_020628 [Ixodes persulcatus]|uniref:Uncharacterized protein n=1 Tax=Ixodes persulcatus TaxID=34615 RepID=A0AC60QGX8_IXOPE|nr:hypothetical protein HPB47_020628 [Ixodes persulcatus]